MKIKPLFSLAILALVFSCAGPIQMKDSWTSPSIEAKKFNKIGLVMVADNEQTKDNVESYMSKEMRAKGYPGVPTFSLFPFAGNEEVKKGMNMTPDEQQAYIRERINKFNFDGIIIITILGSEENIKSKPSVGVGVSAPMTSYDANYTQY